MKQLAVFLVKSVSLFYSYGTHHKFSHLFIKIYSIWIKINFKEYGNATIKSPIYIKGGKYISIGDGFSSHQNFRIEAWDLHMGNTYSPEITIGKNVSFNMNCHVGAIDRIIIKNNVLFGSNVLITDHSHGGTDIDTLKIVPTKRNLQSKGPVIIEEDVWVGDNVSILPGVTIGNNAVIGANSVITKNVPAYSVVVGNPARVIKQIIIQ